MLFKRTLTAKSWNSIFLDLFDLNPDLHCTEEPYENCLPWSKYRIMKRQCSTKLYYEKSMFESFELKKTITG